MDKTYNHHSAKKLLTDKVPTILYDQTIGDIERLLLKEAENFESINYIYLLDSQHRLKGIASVKEIFRRPKNENLKQFTQQKPITIKPNTDQERAAYLALKNNIKAIPVTDHQNRFLGVLPYDTILNTLFYETTEDTMKLGGVTSTSHFDNIFKLSVWRSLKHRLPWLILGLLGGIAASGIVRSFETTLSENLILAAFIPLIVYMADAVGTQMEAFIIRDLAVNPELRFEKYFRHQLLIVSLTALILSILTYIGVLTIYQDSHIGLVVSSALFCAILSSVFSGLMIPFLFGRLKLDPANASGPIATIIQDITSITIYFLIAYFLL